ncbi:MAG: hypothetical protein KA763_00465 [Xanthomonadales bacterium]|nr:hypothetical protein [Xanthomonadales bacterium]
MTDQTCGGRERPILFSAPMVRAILEGRKTQTRRVIKPQPNNVPGKHHPISPYHNGQGGWNWVLSATGHGTGDPFPCPYGQPGDRLYVRETWRAMRKHDEIAPRDIPVGDPVEYVADEFRGFNGKTRTAIHMPRWASRIDLEVTGVRVERLQDISTWDAEAEGVNPCENPNGYQTDEETANQAAFRRLWGSINGADSWAANPWVWVVEFRRIKPVDSEVRDGPP